MLRVSNCTFLHLSVIKLSLLVLPIIGWGSYLELQFDKGPKTDSIITGPKAQKKSKSRSETTSELVMPLMTSSAFVGADRVWLADPRANALQRTTDAGKSWQKLLAEEVTQNTVLSFIDQSHGWRVGKIGGHAGDVWRTTDGGKVWTKISIILRDGGTKVFLTPKQLEFVDKLHGWLIETFGVWRTDDGGASWVEVLSTSDPRLRSQPAKGFFMNDRQAWIAGSEGQVYRTADGGKTWDIESVADSHLSDVFFVDEETGWLSRNYRGQLFRTDDGGRSWDLQPSPGPDLYINSFYFLSKNEGWGVGEQLLDGSQGRMPIDYISKGLVQAILLHTVDGGKSWQPSIIAKNEPFFGRVYFSDPEHGWLLSPYRLYRTIDGGRSWQPIRSVDANVAEIFDASSFSGLELANTNNDHAHRYPNKMTLGALPILFSLR